MSLSFLILLRWVLSVNHVRSNNIAKKHSTTSRKFRCLLDCAQICEDSLHDTSGPCGSFRNFGARFLTTCKTLGSKNRLNAEHRFIHIKQNGTSGKHYWSLYNSMSPCSRKKVSDGIQICRYACDDICDDKSLVNIRISRLLSLCFTLQNFSNKKMLTISVD